MPGRRVKRIEIWDSVDTSMTYVEYLRGTYSVQGHLVLFCIGVIVSKLPIRGKWTENFDSGVLTEHAL